MAWGSRSLAGPLGWPRTSLGIAALGVVVWMCPLPASSAPPSDDWSLERGEDDRTLNEHRVDALRRDPFSTTHWRALQRALGSLGSARLIERRHAASPDDAALRILLARVRLEQGDGAEAVALLSTASVQRGRFATRSLLLTSRAFESLSRYEEAARALLRRPPTMNSATRVRYLERAFTLAMKWERPRLALEIASTWTSEFPASPIAWGARGDAAEASADFSAAASSFQRAVAQASNARRRVAWVKAEARALASADAPRDALARMISLLPDRQAMRTFDAEDWASLLRYAKAADALGALEAAVDTALENRRVPMSWRAHQLRAKIAAARGEPSAPHWERGARAFPRETALALGWMDALEQEGETSVVYNIITSRQRYDDELVFFALEFATRMRAMGDVTTASQIVARTRKLSARHHDGLEMIRDYFNAHEEFDDALAVSKQICARAPKDPIARRRLGDQYLQMGRIDDAIASWNAVAAIVRPRHEGWREVAEIFMSQSGRGKPRVMWDHANHALRRGLALAPEDPGLHRIAGLLAEQQRDAIAAYEAWSRVLDFADADTEVALRDEARSRIVEIVFQLGKRRQRDTLIDALEREALEELEAGPLSERLESARLLSEIYGRLDRREDVIAIWGRLAREAPDNLEVQMQYGRGLRRAGRSGDAIRVLTPLAARIEGDRATPLAMLAELHVARGERDAAIDSAEQASAVTRGPEPLIRVSEALRQRGDLSAAQAALERAVNLFPERPGPLFELGMLAMTSGDLSAATTALTEALSKRGDDYIRKRAGAMALSLVVLTHREAEFLSALAQTATVDSSVSSRGLLAQTIELMDRDALRTWARRNPTLSEQVERQLLHAVRRDPLSTRAVAAETLGKLGAPNSGDTLVRVATRITTPPTISRTERRHLDRLRWEALLAAGALDDPRTFAPLMDAASKSRDPSVEIGATLALANSDHDASLEPLRALLLEDPRSEVKRALVCVGLARAAIRAGARLDAQLRPRIERSRTLARTSTATLSCEIANAVHTRDAQVARLLPLVSRDEQAVAEVAVWRLGRTAHPADHPEIGATLWRTFLASSGSLHAVARAALLRFYGEGTPNTLAPKVAAAPMPRLPLSITEWARDLLAHTEVRADWRRHATLAHAHLARALVSMEQGPRYERRAVTRWNEQCAIRNPPNRRASDSRTEHALLNCLVDGDEGQPRPEHTNASGPR